jgi:cytochrome c553
MHRPKDLAAGRRKLLAEWRPARLKLALAKFLMASLVAGSTTLVSATEAAEPAQPEALASFVSVPDTLAQRLKPCMACHGAEGRASREGYLPRIAGKPEAYLYQQLLNFRDGRRSNATMAGFLAHQRDAYLHEMAGYFAALDLPQTATPVARAPAAVLARGRTLVYEGDTTRRLPACTACHGTALGGSLPAVPGLLGLPRDYLSAQLGAWQTGSRRATAPDCMAEISRRLGPGDVSAVAAWLSSQALANGLKPAAMPTAAPPLPCGSMAAAP